MTKIEFEEEFFNILTKLTTISDSMKIRRVGNDVVVTNSTRDESIVYQLSVPTDKFGLSESEINFVSFSKVDKLYRLTKGENKPEIAIDGQDFIIMDGNRKVKERFATETSIRLVEMADLDEFATVCSYRLKSDELRYLKRAISTINANYIRFNVDGNKLKVTVYDTVAATVGEYEYQLENAATEAKSYTTTTTVIQSLPDYDYDIVFPEDSAVFFKKDPSDGYKLDMAVSLCDDE